MSKLGIFTGSSPNDGTGDSLLQGGLKINSNFDEIYTILGDGSDLSVGFGRTVVTIDSTTYNVGFGSTQPSTKVDVIGNAKFTGYVNAATLNSTNGTITNLNSTNGTVSTLNSTNGTVTNLNSTNTSISNLSGTIGTITTLNSTNGTITTLNSTNGTVSTLNSTNGTVTNLNSTNGTISKLSSNRVTVTNLIGVAGTVTTFDSTNGTITNLSGTNSTVTTLNSTNGYVVSGVVTTLTSTDGSITNLSGTISTITTSIGNTLSYNTGYIVTGVVTTLTSTGATITNLSGTIGTITTLNSDDIYTVSGVVTSLSGSNLIYSGIATVGSISIGSTEIISSQRDVRDVLNLNVSGITTLGVTSASTLDVSGIATFSNVTVTPVSTGATFGSYTGIVTYYGDTSNTVDGRWVIGLSGVNHYTFTGIGFTQTTTDPNLYLVRGRTYEFVNNTAEPFEIRVSLGGAKYNNGVTNNGAASGGVIRFEVPFNSSNTLYYQSKITSLRSGTIFVMI